MSRKQAAEASIAGSASRLKKKKKKVDAKVDAKIVVVCFQRRLRKHLFGVSELKVSVINWFLNIL